MKKLLTIHFALLISIGIYAQSLDEQGLEVPASTHLKQDREAILQAKDGWWKASMTNYRERMSWYNEAKFGCFIHWGVYSVPAGIWKGKPIGGYTEHLMRKAKIPVSEYKEKLIAPFNPTDFDADEWMRTVKAAGMRYFIITAKHHDGFAMFPSDAYPYDIRQTRWGKDPMKALREAARRYGIKFGFYYSHAFDWEHPDAPGNDWEYQNPGGDLLLGGTNWWEGERSSFLSQAEKYVNEKSIPQIQELIRNYDPDILWFDTPGKLPLYLNIRILEAIRKADTTGRIVVNGRLVRFGNQNMGDYRNTGDRAAFFFPTEGAWESIPTTNESYGYSLVDTVRKPVKHFVRLLCTAASQGGNILMNVGPMGNGRWDEKDVSIFKGIGDWLKVNGEAVYGTTRSGLPVQQWGVTTLKGDTLYAHVYEWPKDGRLIIGGLRSDVSHAWAVANPSQAFDSHRLNADDMEILLPSQPLDTLNTVIAMTISQQRPANPVRLLDDKANNILYAFDAELMGNGLGYGDGKPNRNYVKNWKDNTQGMKWQVRQNKATTYRAYLDYNTVESTDSGTVIVEIAGKQMEVSYPPFTEKQGTNSLLIGEISLPQGVSTCILTGKTRHGKQYMNPIAIRLEQPRYLNLRGTLQNSFLRFEQEHHGRVAFLGGSITEMKGWHDMVKELLQRRFPHTEFEFIDAGISSTGTTPHSFRLENDVLSKGPIDLLFVEAAVNDNTNGFTSTDQIRGMEGVVRHALTANPYTDIIMLHFIYDTFIGMYDNGQTPAVITNHERVAEHYQIPSIECAKEIAQRMRSQEFDWNTFGGTHPKPFGHQLYTKDIEALLNQMWAYPEAMQRTPHVIPADCLDDYSYTRGKFVELKKAKASKGWQIEKTWKPRVKANTRKGFVNVPMLRTNQPGTPFTFRFKGRGVGLFMVCGPTSGTLEYSIDGKQYPPLNTYTQWSQRLYIPWLYVLDAELDGNKSHTLKVWLSAGEGKEAIIRNLVVNED